MKILFCRINFKNEQRKAQVSVRWYNEQKCGKKEIQQNNDLKGFRWRKHKNDEHSARIGLKPKVLSQQRNLAI